MQKTRGDGSGAKISLSIEYSVNVVRDKIYALTPAPKVPMISDIFSGTDSL